MTSLTKPTFLVLFIPVSCLGVYGFYSLPEGALTGQRVQEQATKLVGAADPTAPPSTATTVFENARTAVEAVRGDVESAGRRYRELEIEENESKRLIRENERKQTSERDRLRRIEAMFVAGEPYVHPFTGPLSAEALEHQAELGLIEVAALEQEAAALNAHLHFTQNLMAEVRNEALQGPATLRQLETDLRLVALQQKFKDDRDKLVSRLGGTPRNLEETANVATLALRRAQNEVTTTPTNFGRLEFPEHQTREGRTLDIRSRINAAVGDEPPALAFEMRSVE